MILRFGFRTRIEQACHIAIIKRHKNVVLNRILFCYIYHAIIVTNIKHFSLSAKDIFNNTKLFQYSSLKYSSSMSFHRDNIARTRYVLAPMELDLGP